MTSKRQLRRQLDGAIEASIQLAGENRRVLDSAVTWAAKHAIAVEKAAEREAELLVEMKRLADRITQLWAGQDSIVGTFQSRQPDLLRDPAPMPGPVV